MKSYLSLWVVAAIASCFYLVGCADTDDEHVVTSTTQTTETTVRQPLTGTTTTTTETIR